MKGSCAQTFKTFQNQNNTNRIGLNHIVPVTTQEAVCTADVCAPVLQVNIMDDKGTIRQYLKTLSPRVD